MARDDEMVPPSHNPARLVNNLSHQMTGNESGFTPKSLSNLKKLFLETKKIGPISSARLNIGKLNALIMYAGVPKRLTKKKPYVIKYD